MQGVTPVGALRLSGSDTQELIMPLLTERGNVYLRKIFNAHGQTELYEFEWRGGPYVVSADLGALIWSNIATKLPEQGSTLTLGPYRLKVLHDPTTNPDPLNQRWVFVCEDGLIARAHYMIWNGSQKLRLVWSRLIRTFDLWGLAFTPDGSVPSVRDIYFVKMVGRWRKLLG